MSNVVDERDDNGEGTGETLIVGLPASSTVTQSPPLGGNGGGRHSATSRIRGVTFDGFKRRAAAAVSTVGSIPSSVPIDADENSAVAAVSRHMMMRSSDVATDSSGVEHVLIDDTPGHSQYRERGETKLRCYDVDYDGDTKMPAEKSSLKNSLKIEDAILRLNIGGASYRIRTRSILKYGPNTLLGRFCRMDHEHRRSWADAFFEESDEYFFERVPRYFDPIYDFYAAGKLHVPKDLCFDKFMGELRFWAVSKAKMDDCCSPFAQYCLMRKMPSDQPEKDHFIGLRCAKIRRRLWLILEGHSHSKWWKLFEITSTSFVVLSITALILGSMPEFQVPENTRQSFNL